MKSLPLLAAAILLPALTPAQSPCGGSDAPFTVLHYTATNGFDHNTRDVSAQLFRDLGALDNFTVVDTDDAAAAFGDATALADYAVVVFSNTSGNGLLDAGQQANLESYIAGGGTLLGIHAATDTYRDRSWPFYNDLVGGIVQTSPNHTAAGYSGVMDKLRDHPTVAGVPVPWAKDEEYYYWERNGGQLDPDIVPVLEVRSTGTQSYDAPRPMSWYQTFPSGARSFYTALGHARGNYTDPDNDFRRHLRDALCWLAEVRPVALAVGLSELSLSADAAGQHIHWRVASGEPVGVELYGGPTEEAADVLARADPAGGLLAGTLTDPTPAADTRLYRLRFVEADGEVTWSDWLAADYGRASLSVTAALDGALVVTADAPALGREARIFSVDGREVGRLNLTQPRQRLPSLTPGYYVLRVDGPQPPVRFVVR